MQEAEEKKKDGENERSLKKERDRKVEIDVGDKPKEGIKIQKGN